MSWAQSYPNILPVENPCGIEQEGRIKVELTGFPEWRRQRWNSKKLESCEAKKIRVCRTDPDRRDLQGEIVLGFFTSSPLYLQMSKKQQHGWRNYTRLWWGEWEHKNSQWSFQRVINSLVPQWKSHSENSQRGWCSVLRRYSAVGQN